MEIIEIIGYVASALVAFSLTMKKILRLRMINLTGSLFFVAYGFVISAYPVAFLNLFSSIVNILYLWKLIHVQDSFELLFLEKNSEFILKFLEKNSADINYFYPEFKLEILENSNCVFILRNLTAVGIFVYETRDNVAYIHLDYVVPEYRDFKNARFLFSRTDKIFQGLNVHKLVTKSKVEKTINYLARMDFKKEEEFFMKEI